MVILIVWVSSFLLLSLLIMLFSQKLLSKEEWTSDLWIVEMSKKWLLLLWLVYFMVRLIRLSDEGLFDGLEQRALAMVNYFKMLIGVNAFWEPLDILLGLTVTWLTYSLIYKGIKAYGKYELLSPQEFPEYDFPFQRDLVDFLNREPKFGQNTYWLDGGWGTGKTHFLRTFFKEQDHKELEIYYVSCFGITTRGQAEQVLTREIEDRSSFGSLDHIPVISSLVKWGFKTVGLDLMKKDSVVIFDDLERVVYSGKRESNNGKSSAQHSNVRNENYGDDPKDYNDLLGFIDYLANHKNQKVIVVYNSKDIINTKAEIVDKKFAPMDYKMPSVAEIIDKIISDKVRDLCIERKAFVPIFLEKVYNLEYLSLGTANFRKLVRDLEEYSPYDVDAFNLAEEVKELILSSFKGIVSSEHLRLLFEELKNLHGDDIDTDNDLPKLFSIRHRIVDGISTSEAFSIWNSYVELLELLKNYDILEKVDLPTLEELNLSYDNLEAEFEC